MIKKGSNLSFFSYPIGRFVCLFKFTYFIFFLSKTRLTVLFLIKKMQESLDIWTGKQESCLQCCLLKWHINLHWPEFGMIRCPPSALKEPKAVHEGSRDRARVCVRRLMVSLSRRACGSLGESLDEMSERSSWGVTIPDELYTLIFRLGRGSSRGELVMGILSVTSWRA